jgi:hypothetical protein
MGCKLKPLRRIIATTLRNALTVNMPLNACIDNGDWPISADASVSLAGKKCSRHTADMFEVSSFSSDSC